MGDGSHIGWTQATWNPLLGCRKVSHGCDHCYAILTTNRLAANPQTAASYQGLVRREPTGELEWTGQVNLLPERLRIPLHWTRPRRIFVNSQSDLFHKDVPDEFIARVYAVMALTPQHIYQVLTKRPGRMRSLLSAPFGVAGFTEQVKLAMWELAGRDKAAHAARKALPPVGWWPLPNVHLGTSVEDQHWAAIRIPQLVDTPAAVRWLSCEPLLAPLDLTPWMPPGYAGWRCSGCLRFYAGPHQETCPGCGRCGYWSGSHTGNGRPNGQPLGWVVVGGESGKGSRPMRAEWAADLQRQCREAGTPFFYKQTGAVLAAELGLPGKGDDPALWPFEWVQQYPRELAVSGA